MDYTFSDITSGQTDADSIINQQLMDAIRQDLYHLKEFCYGTTSPYTPIAKHDHDGANSAPVASVAAGAISTSELKTATGSGSTTSVSGEDQSFIPSQYGFMPLFYSSSASRRGDWMIYDTDRVAWKLGTSQGLTIRFRVSEVGYTAYWIQRYVQASPPHSIAEHEWQHFLFLLRKIADGEIISAWEAPDPPWAYLAPWTGKNSPQQIAVAPHPFARYRERDPSADGLEICLVDPREMSWEALGWTSEQLHAAKKLSILEDLSGKINPPLGKEGCVDLKMADVPGFTDRVVIRRPF
jgi:hypothetical protein